MGKALIKNGRYDMAAIMRKAWAYVKSPFTTAYRKDFRGALKTAWADARVAMDACKASISEAAPEVNRGNVLKRAFLAGNPEYRYYDSSWRI